MDTPETSEISSSSPAKEPSIAGREEIVRTIDVVKEYKLAAAAKEDGGASGAGDNGVSRVLKGINLTIYKGEYISIMGPSGSGKSTLFNAIGGLDKPTSGKVFIDEVDVAQLDALELAWLRCRKIGYIFQTFNLIPVMTALENVALPMIFAGLSTTAAQEKAAGILRRVELGHRLFNRPSQLSGGQQQRVAIARAFANDPAIILADEPTGNLDLNTGKAIIGLLREMNKERGVTIISATHDFKMLDVSDRIIWIRDGQIDKIQRREEVDIRTGEIH
jgi:putative ABC transport system ATP-binding protein